MQNDNASHLSPDLTITNPPDAAKVTIVPGALDDVIDVFNDGETDKLPVHIKPSPGKSGATGGDRITVGKSLADGSAPGSVIFDYNPSVALNLYSLTIGSRGTVAFDASAPLSFVMNVTNLGMVKDAELLRFSSLDLKNYGIRITNFTGVIIDDEGVTTTVDISGIGAFLYAGFIGKPTDHIEIWSSTANTSVGTAIRVIHEPTTLLLRSAHDGDANFDGKVDIVDLYILNAHWNASHTPPNSAIWSEADFNGDGWVDSSDLTFISLNWQYGV